ncbi:3'(2'),5'-bisphosphate nucleotidase CysQ [Pelagibacterium montanilacus]|uniref:3'(2'),5'-bisphosphate nucleotidase CysQ n=1 Tax=Pelagibacterium montanilacus TaxID=2185280 RepID=UPI001FEBA8DB|nr:3'(2'),5'-bisphosphate nucleotidase CysQ [Pelagibacterium montanilacus]
MLEKLCGIGLEAGAIILDIYGRAFSVETKADNSPLTEADTAAEALILDRLAVAFPDIPVIAEEAVAAGRVPATGKRFFLVDPLDGSKEFIARNDEFTVNIALIEDGVPTHGMICAPALGRLWWGGPDGAFTATCKAGKMGKASSIRTRSPAPDAGLVLVGSRSHASEVSEPRLEGLCVAQARAVGSSLKFCLIAEGEADIYPRLGRTMEWDIAAGDAIVRAAGGLVLDAQGRPFGYDKRNQSQDVDFANGYFWVFGDRSLASRIFPGL